MDIFWFIMTCIFFFLWVNKKPQQYTTNEVVEPADNDTTTEDYSYRTGLQDENQEPEPQLQQEAASSTQEVEEIVLEEVALSPEDHPNR